MLLFELSLAHVVEGLIRSPSGGTWKVVWNAPPPHSDRTGKFGRCTRFDGETSKITISGIVCPRTFTFAAWVKCGPLVRFHYAAILGFGHDRPFFGFHQGRPLLLNGVVNNSVVTAAWTHVAVAQDQETSRMYVNGVLVSESISLAVTGGAGLAIGCDMGRGYAWFEGEMAHVMVLDEALDEAGVQRIMASRCIDVPPPPEMTPTIPAGVSPEVPPAPRLPPSPPPPVSPSVRVPPPPPSPPAAGPQGIMSDAAGVGRVRIDHEVEVPVPTESNPTITLEIPVVGEVVEVATAAPTSTQLRWAAHLPFLESLLEVFPSAALGDLIATLRAGLLPSSSPGCRVSGWLPTEGGSVVIDGEPLVIEAGGAPIVEISGVDGDPPALWLQLAPRVADAAPPAAAWLRATVRLLSGAIARVVECELSLENGLALTLVGGAFGDAVETVVELSSASRCRVSSHWHFGYSGKLGATQIHARVAAAMVVTADGPDLRQQIEFSLQLDGEQLSVTAAPEHLVVSADGLRRVFEDALREKVERDGLGVLFEGGRGLAARFARAGEALRPAFPSLLRRLGR